MILAAFETAFVTLNIYFLSFKIYFSFYNNFSGIYSIPLWNIPFRFRSNHLSGWNWLEYSVSQTEFTEYSIVQDKFRKIYN